MIEAPFTKEQVIKLNEYQNGGGKWVGYNRMHPFTCCSPDHIEECQRKDKHYPDGRISKGINEGILIATIDGWVCPCGKYKQLWAHDFMAE